MFRVQLHKVSVEDAALDLHRRVADASLGNHYTPQGKREGEGEGEREREKERERGGERKKREKRENEREKMNEKGESSIDRDAKSVDSYCVL